MDICSRRIVWVTYTVRVSLLDYTCVSHFVSGHFLRIRSLYYHQTLHWSMQLHYQSDLHESESFYSI